MVEWLFLKQRKADINQETVIGEFFADESTDPANSLVREFIQNSLDASASDKPVEVSFRLGSLSKSTAETYIRGLEPHFKASDTEGLHADVFTGTCRYLVAEDFETHGLTGDPAETFRDPMTKHKDPNDFYYFVRSQGASEKSSKKLVTWGVGKFTYPMTSDINSLFALTVRSNAGAPGGAGPLLIGQSFLRNHSVGSVDYKPHGWWASLDGDPSDPLPMPFVSGSTELSEFEEDFEIDRNGRSGLTIVVPFVEDDLTAAALLRAVLLNYSATVLLRQLVITVTDETGSSVRIDADNVVDFGRSFDAGVWAEIGPEIELLDWWANGGAGSPIELLQPSVATQTKWDERLTDEQRASISEALQQSTPIVVRVPVHVALQRGVKIEGIAGPTWSYADVVLQSVEGSTTRIAPAHYREGLRIANVKSSKPVGVRAITIVEDGPLARMVSLSEGPAHTDWSSRSRNFVRKFIDGKNVLALVKDLGALLVRHARSTDSEEKVNLARDIFILKKPHIDEPEEDEEEGEEGDIPPVQPAPVRIDPRAGGFTVALTKAAEVGQSVGVRVAYDIARGNAMKRWSPFDFEMGTLTIDYTGLSMSICADNFLEFTVVDLEAFHLDVTGFDLNRDLIIKAEIS